MTLCSYPKSHTSHLHHEQAPRAGFGPDSATLLQTGNQKMCLCLPQEENKTKSEQKPPFGITGMKDGQQETLFPLLGNALLCQPAAVGSPTWHDKWNLAWCGSQLACTRQIFMARDESLRKGLSTPKHGWLWRTSAIGDPSLLWGRCCEPPALRTHPHGLPLRTARDFKGNLFLSRVTSSFHAMQNQRPVQLSLRYNQGAKKRKQMS